ncbi:MAG: hypothetical protein OXU61_00920 [Gammaproteobacteria bacterium]|nr:hypothetical protein [Gammaproteobacteria bacterium]
MPVFALVLRALRGDCPNGPCRAGIPRRARTADACDSLYHGAPGRSSGGPFMGVRGGRRADMAYRAPYDSGTALW